MDFRRHMSCMPSDRMKRWRYLALLNGDKQRAIHTNFWFHSHDKSKYHLNHQNAKELRTGLFNVSYYDIISWAEYLNCKYTSADMRYINCTYCEWPRCSPKMALKKRVAFEVEITIVYIYICIYFWQIYKHYRGNTSICILNVNYSFILVTIIFHILLDILLHLTWYNDAMIVLSTNQLTFTKKTALHYTPQTASSSNIDGNFPTWCFMDNRNNSDCPKHNWLTQNI